MNFKISYLVVHRISISGQSARALSKDIGICHELHYVIPLSAIYIYQYIPVSSCAFKEH